MMSAFIAAFTFLNWIPGYEEFNSQASAKLASISGMPVNGITHLVFAVIAMTVVFGLVAVTRASWGSDSNPVIPQGKFSIRNAVETIMDATLNFGEMVLGSRKQARRFMPLIGALAFYIFFMNTLGLFPFFTPATDNLNITAPPAIIVFFITHYIGVKENGFHYLEHFLGPKIGGMFILAPLFIPLEIISHVARPVSLSLRLMGNMIGDHAVLAVFGSMFVTLPFLGLGLIVCTVQTLVFCVLSLVYIALSLEHSEEGH
jgi:F-type H+-transporting ATPase subunit a